VTQRRPAAAVVRETRSELAKAGLAPGTEVSLAPFARDHVALVVPGR
jgi:fibrillarin-like rRNA methylase